MTGNQFNDVRQLVITSAMDDWISDYEIQGDFQAELSLDPPAAFAQMKAQVPDWIRRGVLVPGDLQDGFVQWSGTAEELAMRFAASSSALHRLARPGQICWFDIGPNAASGLTHTEAA
jgi:hypothetical protein